MSSSIDSVLQEKRVFRPAAPFLKKARLSGRAAYEKLYKQSLRDPEKFWKKQAAELSWAKPFKKVLQWKAPHAKWFVGGKLNVSYNCIDRHIEAGRGQQAALIWEGEPGDSRTLTYRQLHREVCFFANVLKKHGVRAGDRVVIYLPMIPEAAVAMLACARIGAVHSVVFGGFSAEAVRDRIADCGAKIVVTADGGYRRGAAVGLKGTVDQALASGQTGVKTVLVVRRTGAEMAMQPGRDLWWHEEAKTVSADCPPVPLDSEHPLFILYTSGSTGKPKGILHTTGGYLLGALLTTRWAFDLREGDLFFCTADVGWITGHSYVVYGILANGGTSLLYEGAPNHPQPDRFWEIVEKYQVDILYTAPTAIRACIKWGDEWPAKHDLSSLRVLGTVGEPINPEAWIWFYEKIGGKRCPIVDTWWQTETGSHMILPLPGVPMKPGAAGLPFFGVEAAVVDEQGKDVPPGKGGKLVIRRPWPSMLRTIHGDDQRYADAYWKEVPGAYFTGDGARRDKDGYFWIVGRIDDVLNVSGHRLGTSEIESALVTHPQVAEAAAVGRPDPLKGQGVVVFVTVKSGIVPAPDLADALRQHVGRQIGPIARPDEVRFAEALPKTRSGKIMRRLLKEIAAGGEVKGDVTALDDFHSLSKLRGIED
ncbi:MAG: acetate--CoA ligase [Verrucomicrobium sp.]|nr:acetate--CoA ligase [Verrucomicrobium sp.]